MEAYLKEQYNVYEDERYLTSVDDLEDFIRDCDNLFDCGQGYYTDEETIICKIEDKFYRVTAIAEIESSKQEYGDRLYRVGRIKSVTYEEIEKPKPKDKSFYTYELELTDDQRRSPEWFMKENYIEF
ncbi:hypothetical protein Elgi_38620 [Paenibacillus elgii]|uniref:hypothetical protein n=1 Tax=Paenibacillus elgii TaxID=189691 RepID=UPI002D7CD33E|nr:hypothetical protein Elgi_38620 [Paenibacillus elgii]